MQPAPPCLGVKVNATSKSASENIPRPDRPTSCQGSSICQGQIPAIASPLLSSAASAMSAQRRRGGGWREWRKGRRRSRAPVDRWRCYSDLPIAYSDELKNYSNALTRAATAFSETRLIASINRHLACNQSAARTLAHRTGRSTAATRKPCYLVGFEDLFTISRRFLAALVRCDDLFDFGSFYLLRIKKRHTHRDELQVW